MQKPTLSQDFKKWLWYKIITHPSTLWTSIEDYPDFHQLYAFAVQNDIIDFENQAKQTLTKLTKLEKNECERIQFESLLMQCKLKKNMLYSKQPN